MIKKLRESHFYQLIMFNKTIYPTLAAHDIKEEKTKIAVIYFSHGEPDVAIPLVNHGRPILLTIGREYMPCSVSYSLDQIEIKYKRAILPMP
jgi:hypothetical protein